MTVYLVGAGPGDPGLFTCKGAELLRNADVVVHDRLGTAELLPIARPDARLIDVGKAPGRAAMTQPEINAVLVREGRVAQCVVRLKGGDPFVFGRGGEEADALRAAGLAFEVVPGVTSAIAAAAYAGIPVTHRGVSTHFTVVTGHEDPAKGTTDTDWDALARIGGTIVILMGAAHIADIAQRLIAAGRDRNTAVAAIRWGTTARQHTIRTTLAGAGTAGITSPSAIVIGDVAALDFGWFEQRPLFGSKVVVTRAREQASALTARLAALGAEVIELPSIAMKPIEFNVPDITAFEWIVFTSANGVEHFMQRGLLACGADARALHLNKVAAIGPGTYEALQRFGINADLVPERFIAESLLAQFPDPCAPQSKVLVVRPVVARDALPDGLRARGYHVDILGVYETVRAAAKAADLDAVRDGSVDVITFTSSSTVANFVDLVGPIGPAMPTIVSIGPQTSAAVLAHGLQVDVEADPHDIDGLVNAVVIAVGHQHGRP